MAFHQQNNGGGKGKEKASTSTSAGSSRTRNLDLTLSLGFPDDDDDDVPHQGYEELLNEAVNSDHQHQSDGRQSYSADYNNILGQFNNTNISMQFPPAATFRSSSPTPSNTHPQQYYGGGSSSRSPNPAPSAFGFINQQPNYYSNNPTYHYYTGGSSTGGGYSNGPVNSGMAWTTSRATPSRNSSGSTNPLPSPPPAPANNFNMMMMQRQGGGPVSTPAGSQAVAAGRVPQMYQQYPNSYSYSSGRNNTDTTMAGLPFSQLAPPLLGAAGGGVNMHGYQYQPPQLIGVADNSLQAGGAVGFMQNNVAVPGRRGEGNYFPVGKRCRVCRSEDTPMWRRGPGGPKTLCNACGIKFRKEEERKRAREATNGAGAGQPNQ